MRVEAYSRHIGYLSYTVLDIVFVLYCQYAICAMCAVNRTVQIYKCENMSLEFVGCKKTSTINLEQSC